MRLTVKRVAAASILLLLGILLVLHGQLREALVTQIAAVQSLGAPGALLFALLYIVSTVLALPASVLTIAAGLLYGPYWAALVVLSASLTGATIAFALARSWLHPWVQGRYGESVAFRMIAARTQKDGAKLVFMLRLSPIVPFSVLNYVLGLTQVSLRRYVVASALGMIPGIFLYTYIGSTLGSLADLNAVSSTSGAGRVLLWVGLAATLIVTIVLARWAAQALQESAETQS